MKLDAVNADAAEGAAASHPRARRLKRLGVVLLGVLTFVGVIPFLVRAILVSRIPDVGDPFDVKAFAQTKVPDEENGFTWYRRAAAKLKPAGHVVHLQLQSIKGWSDASPDVRRWLESNREALEIFRMGSKTPAGQSRRPMEYSDRMSNACEIEVHTCAQLAILEAGRREEAGDVSGAWDLYKAVLRASRQVTMNGCAWERRLGSGMLCDARDHILRWSTHSDLDERQLRQAVTDMQDCYRLTPRPSHKLKVEYIRICNTLRNPEVLSLDRGMTQFESALGVSFVESRIGQFGLYFWGEPAISRRVAQLVFANQLLQCDSPPKVGALAPVGNLHLYPPNPSLAPQRQFTPAELNGYYSQTVLANLILFDLSNLFNSIFRDEMGRAELVVALLLQAYFRVHGEFPAQLDALLEGYLEEPALTSFGPKGNRFYYKRTADGASLISITVKTPSNAPVHREGITE